MSATPLQLETNGHARKSRRRPTAGVAGTAKAAVIDVAPARILEFEDNQFFVQTGLKLTGNGQVTRLAAG